MTVELTQLLKQAYPTGTTDDLNELSLYNDARDLRLRAVLQRIVAECGLNFSLEPAGWPINSTSPRNRIPIFGCGDTG